MTRHYNASREPSTTVFMVEDSPAIRERLMKLLEAIPVVHVVGYADGAAEAIDKISRSPPAAIVLDLKLKEGSGLQVLEAVKRRAPGTTVFFFNDTATTEIRQACLNAGADHFLDKTNEYQNVSGILKQLHAARIQGDSSCKC